VETYRCTCNVGYVTMEKHDATSDPPKIRDAQNIRLKNGDIHCAICDELIYTLNKCT